MNSALSPDPGRGEDGKQTEGKERWDSRIRRIGRGRGAVLPAVLALAVLTQPVRVPGEASVVRRVALDADNGDYAPLDDSNFSVRSHGTIDIAPNGTVGMLHREVPDPPNTYDIQMVLHEFDVSGARHSEAVNTIHTSSPDRQPMATVAYDLNSRPHVVCGVNGKLYLYTRSDEDGLWKEALLEFDLAGYFGGNPATRYTPIRLVRGLDGNVHLIFTASAGQGAGLLFQATLGAGGWWVRSHGDYRTLLIDGAFTPEDFFAWQVDGSGRLHVGFSSSEPYGDINNLPRERLNWARSAGAGWTREVLRQGATVDDRPAWNAHMALDRNGNPRALSLHTTHVVTGSMQTAKLYYYIRTGENSWTRELIAETADGYVGGDGNRYTGEYPHLVFDDRNRPHVVFVDIASWHWECFEGTSCNDQIRGQLRYAWKSGGAWKTLTLYEQDGQSASPNPLYLFEAPDLAVSPGGGHVYAYGMEHFHFSTTYAYDQDARKKYRVLFVEAANTEGDDPPSDFQAILQYILGYPVSGDGLDKNGDTGVDISDAVRANQ